MEAHHSWAQTVLCAQNSPRLIGLTPKIIGHHETISSYDIYQFCRQSLVRKQWVILEIVQKLSKCPWKWITIKIYEEW